MSNIILSNEGFGLKMYNRFPPKYRVDDIDQRYALRRYLEAIGEGGFRYSIDEFNGILDFANPDMATPKALPLLYQQYGFDLFHGIPEEYLRYLLPRLGEAWSKKGSLDVIEFVVSALSGIKTETITNYDQHGNPNVDIRLEMDVNLGSFFPDPKQFERIVEKFLPFYVGKTIIYVFVFDETQDIHGDTNHRDHVVYRTKEIASFPYSGLRFVPVLNDADRVLNSTLILNGYERFAEDPDVFFDHVGLKYHEQGSFNSRWSYDFVGGLNNDRLNVDLILNKFRTDTDWHKDVFHFRPVVEEAPFVVEDKRHDHVVLDEKVRYFPTLNTSLTLNSGLYTNQSNVEVAILSGTDETDTLIPITKYKEEGALSSADIVVHQTVRTAALDDTASVNSEDKRHDDVRMDTKVIVFPMLNSGFTLNSGFSLNYSNVDSEAIHLEDTSEHDQINTTVQEDVYISTSAVAMLGMFTNTRSVLNSSGLTIPDAYDLVTHKSGEQSIIFSAC